VLDVRGLRVAIDGAELISGIDLRVEPGECVAVVGESGAGKSLTARALLGLLPSRATAGAETLMIDGHDARSLSARGWRRLRGASIALVSQDALVSLDPLRRIAAEVAEPLEIHEPRTGREARARRVDEVLRSVSLPEPDRRARQYPYELSGGLRQRALLATALAARPRVLVADEPTTALDATVQVRILELLREIADTGVGVVLISHDLGAVRRIADRVVVLQGGRVVEEGSTDRMLRAPSDPYTRRLVETVEHRPRPQREVDGPPLFTARGLTKRFGDTTAVDDVSLTVHRGRTLAVIGESGSGKTTLARMIVGVERPDAGSMDFDGHAWDAAVARGRARTRVQLVHQNPYGALDPRWSVERALREALAVGGVPQARRAGAVLDLLQEVGLDGALATRRPDRLSGGQRQRVAIARALAVNPALLVLDEPVSALDVTVRERILDLLRGLQVERDLAMVFVTHDLDVVAGVADDVLVMQNGAVVEEGPVTRVLAAPQHPFTEELVAAAGLTPPDARDRA
jgi:peptide/nickel transport system ATP-binding protein